MYFCFHIIVTVIKLPCTHLCAITIMAAYKYNKYFHAMTQTLLYLCAAFNMAKSFYKFNICK